MSRAPAWARAAIVALAIAALASFARCPFALITRHPCPGCGLTRATLALLGGDVGGSLRHHPLAIVVAPALAFVGAREAIAFARGRPSTLLSSRLERAVAATIAGALVVAWIARFFGAFGGPEPV